MKVMLIDTEIMQPQVIETPGGLEEWQRLIGCRVIDIACRKIGGKYFDFIIDDEGLFRQGAKVTVLNAEQKAVLVGNLIICNFDSEGNETTLTDEDIRLIENHLVVLTQAGTDKPVKWLAINGTED